MQWESWEFVKRPLLDERNLNGIPWNACSSWFRRVFVVLSARLLRRVLHDLRRVVHLALRELLGADRRGLTSHARRVLSKPSPPPRAEELLSHVTTEGANSITTLACRGIAVTSAKANTWRTDAREGAARRVPDVPVLVVQALRNLPDEPCRAAPCFSHFSSFSPRARLRLGPQHPK